MTDDYWRKLYEERTAEADRLRLRCEALEAQLRADAADNGEELHLIYVAGQHSRDDEMRALQAGLQPGRWVACADKLPEEHGEYLAASKPRPRGWVTVYAPAGWICPIDFPVTHWMPLPEPAP